jgi:lactoylglutathione lyase
MKLEHIGIWVEDLEIMRAFYMKYFNMECSDLYTNERKGFSSYFLYWNNGARLEIMHQSDVMKHPPVRLKWIGYTHIAISLDSKEAVIELTEQLRNDGYGVAGEPRITGDGYFESVVLDPEENRVELIA